MEKEEKIEVLYVDDEANNLQAFRSSFRRDFNVLTADSAEKALNILKENSVHVIITDQRMPDTTGVEFLESILEAYPYPVRILLTGYSDTEAVIDAINKGQIFHYLNKPWKYADLKKTVHKAYKIYKSKKDKEKLTNKLMTANEQLEFMLRQRLLS
ncbi:MAG: response regulator [Flavobacteriales bacterium]|nr:response regulator [Flavobacteriales bacterium]